MSEVVVAAPEAPAAPAAPSAPTAAAPAAPAPAEDGKEPVQTEAGKAPAAEPEGAKKPDTDQDPEKQRGSRRFERKIDRLHRRAAEAEARAALYERQLQEAQQRQGPKDDPNAPRIEQFDDIEKYAAAKAKYEADRVLNEHRAKQQAETQKQHAARLSSEWEEKIERAADKYDDFADVVGEIKPTNPLSVAIMRAKNGEDVAYHLGKNPAVAKEILSLGDPFLQVLAIGELSARLAAEPKKPPQTSKAPAPITPVSGASQADPNVPSEKDDMKAWMQKRQKQVHGARR